MGTRINVLLDHALTDLHDREMVMKRLADALTAALAIRDYWQKADPRNLQENVKVWQANPVASRDPILYRYTGPGSLFLTVTPAAAPIRTGGRWRGFLSIEPLRRSHLAAFRQIAGAFGSSCMALYADSSEVDDLFWGGQSHWECIELMERLWGPPQPSVDEIDPCIVAATERTVPRMWFLESTSGKK